MSSPVSQTPSQTVLYSERLLPALWIWLVVAGISGTFVLAFIPISLTVGIVVAIVAALVLAALLLMSTPRIRVTPETLQVGRAEIERRWIGEVAGFRGEDATQQRGPAMNATAYLCIRGWISPVVKIEITDPADRTPYWLTSTRHPEKLVEALQQTSR
ncbi:MULTISPECIES: DUF3093 domain-containing protein [Arthrobacter]|uniref:DUF3093 domain-containing protein n=1 Tax=Arthrobacter caoxuetaonis TaxID=2886935 RepID=A0A9X1MH30_9MICC|nr:MULTISPECIES: DUF3093 domain-containing protein [Arthrobacter]MCC3283773.1 DUF3093 domain-containing protein [Arthrobacter caoxuetaonis]MCC3299085.1 DUF3093 domain-containing protein [Arthrobacter caoxuetaonis]MCC9193210.1 DUF3093 domain-containing protein [Arthrobacter sp. zg-Y916]USQ58581.1 DUF3093 domain-containing protein [Arthrobacter caoxuetaonis]